MNNLYHDFRWRSLVKWRKRKKTKKIPIMVEVQAKSLKSAVKNAKPKKVKNLPKRKRKERQRVTYQTPKMLHLLPKKKKKRLLLPKQNPKKPKRNHHRRLQLPKMTIHQASVMFAITLA